MRKRLPGIINVYIGLTSNLKQGCPSGPVATLFDQLKSVNLQAEI